MTDLIVCLSTGKGSWAHAARVIDGMEWNKVFLITNSSLAEQCRERFKECFKAGKKGDGGAETNAKAEMVIIETQKTITQMAEDIKKALEGRIADLEVALNIVSGDGREHMAVISALLQLGLGIRLVALTKEGVRTL